MENNNKIVVDEYERKFLLSRIPPKKVMVDNLGDIHRNGITKAIKQYYLTKDGSRFRIIDNIFGTDYELIRKKKIENGHNVEIINNLTKRSIITLKNLVKDNEYTNSISKFRYEFTYQNNKFCIDDFDNITLAILEVETPSMDSDIKFPKWLEGYIICEVTNLGELSNQNLARYNNI